MYEKWGSSRWAEDEEIKRDLALVDLKNDTNEQGGMLITRNEKGEVFVDPGERFNLVIGGTGSGKTLYVLIPTIYSIIRQKEKSNLVIYDTKAEIMKYTKHALDRAGYRTVIYNFKNMTLYSDCYNPLYLPACLYKSGQEEEAIQLFFNIAETIFPADSDIGDDKFWINASMNYATGLFITAAELLDPVDVNFDNVFSLHLAGNKEYGSDIYFKRLYKGREDTMGYRLLSVLVDSPSGTRRSIISVFSEEYTRLISNKSLTDILSGIPTLSPREMIESEKPVAVFILVDDMGSYAKKAASMIIEQYYQELIRCADLEYGGRLPRRLDLILDEFSSIKLGDINQKVSASRSRNIRFTLAAQGLKQLSLVYGPELASVILGNMGNLLYLSSTDLDLQRYIQDRAGVQVTSYTHEKRPLFSLADLQHIKQGYMLVFHGNNYPYLCTSLVSVFKYHIIDELYDISTLPKRNAFTKRHIDMWELIKRKIKERLIDEIDKGNHRQTGDTYKRTRRVRNRWTLTATPGDGLFFYKDNNFGHVGDRKDEKYYEVIYSEELFKSEVLILYLSETEDDNNTHVVHVALHDLPGPKTKKIPLKNIDDNKSVKEVKTIMEHAEDVIKQMNDLFGEV